jgi:exodeoxyribonuclease VII large subunit
VRFRLREGDYGLLCTVFRPLARRLPFRIEDGQQLVVEGRVEVYESWGQLQLVARAVELDQSAQKRETLSTLKARAQKEGWLAKERKRSLPCQPKMIGLIAGGDSRARSDVRGSIIDAGVRTQIFVETVHMEGPDTAQEICTALAALNARPEIEAVVIARGGGSAGALAALNDWELAQAIVNSRAPVLTAIGHRQDETLADLVADVRVPTPSTVGMAWADLRVPAPTKGDTPLAEEQPEEREQDATPTDAVAEAQIKKRDPVWAMVVVVVVVLALVVLARALGWI